MSEHMFKTGHGRVTKIERKRIEVALKAAGITNVDFVVVNTASTGARFWFSGPHRGHPFDARLELEVEAAVGKVRTY